MSDVKPSEKALQIAAQCWCDPETSGKVMDIELAVAFAKRLDNDYAAIAELTERNVNLSEKLRVAIEALEFLRDRFYSDDCEGPELRAQNAIAYRTAKETLSKLKGEGE